MDLENEDVIVVIMHPGVVKTGLSPWDHDLPEVVESEDSTTKLWTVLLSKGIEDIGDSGIEKVMNYLGE